MEPPGSNPHPDVFFRQLTAEEHERLRFDALARARANLPCSECGSGADPVVRKPERLSVDWWIDPSSYLACADCGHFLGLLPVWLQYPAWFMSDRRAGF